MDLAWFAFGRGEGMWLLWGGAAGLLISVMAASRPLARFDRPAPTLHALLHWLPIAVAAIVAAGLGASQLAVGIIFGTSVAALCTVTGFITMSEPLADLPTRAQHVWMFLPVPALLVFLLGFTGNLGLFEAVALAIQGVLAGVIWFGAKDADEIPMAEMVRPRRPWRPGLMGAAELVLALCLAGVAAWAAVRGTEAAHAGDIRFAPGAVGASLLSAALVVPMINTGTPLATRGQAWASLTAQAGVMLLNLGVLLPAVIFTAMARQWFEQRGAAGPMLFEPVLYSRVAWRIDAVVLLILCLLFVPVAAGRLKFDRVTAGWLIGGYGVYLLMVIVLGRFGPL